MTKPTETQLDVVNDLEAALKMMLQEENADRITIGMLTERANISPASLYGVVARLQVGRNYDLLNRLREVFRHATKMPQCLTFDGAKDYAPSIETSAGDSQSALSTILNVLKPFSETERDRIISSTSMFFGIGI